MTLDVSEVGRMYRIKNLMVEDRTMRRLEALGFIEGTKVLILNRKRYGAVICKVRGTRMALGKNIASRIEVEHE